MVLVILSIPYAAIKHLKTMGLTAKDWFGDIASIHDQYSEKPMLVVVVGHPELVDDTASQCGQSLPVFTSPEPAAQALAALWHYSKARNKNWA